MKPKNFIKTFCLCLIALLVPLLLFGSITSFVTKQRSRRSSETSNTNYLHQIRYNTEMILDQINQLSLAYDLNTDVGYQLDLGLQRAGSTYMSNQIFETIRAFSTSESNSRPYIHSTYIYFNYSSERFFSSEYGITELSSFPDLGWYDSYKNAPASNSMWTELRTIRKNDFGQSVSVLTIYRRTFSRPGVIVLNLLPRYIDQELFSGSASSELPYIAVLNETGEVVLSNDGCPFSPSVSLSELCSETDGTFMYSVNDEKYSICQLSSDKYDWKYLAVVPESTLYAFSAQLSSVLIMALFVCIIFGLALALAITYRNYYQMQSIMQLLDAAEAGNDLPSVSSSFLQDEYAVLTENLVKTFVEQHYRKLALSENIFHRKALELLALQAQINPHFLFNTLKTIYWKALSLTNGKNNDVCSMVDSLSGILRYSLDNPKSLVRIGEEIEQTQNYIGIQSIRYPDKFTVDIKCESGLEDERIQRMLFQPIVENSIQHGILPKEGVGKIRIRLTRVEDMIRISITDNGIGISPAHLEELKQEMLASDRAENEVQHIGLVNTVRRLTLRYGSKFKSRIHSIDGVGTSILLYIPILSEQDFIDETSIYGSSE